MELGGTRDYPFEGVEPGTPVSLSHSFNRTMSRNSCHGKRRLTVAEKEWQRKINAIKEETHEDLSL